MLQAVVAVIKPHRLADVKDALRDVGVAGLTVSEVKGFGRQGGHTETYRGAEYEIDLLPKLKVEVVCEAAATEAVVEAVVGAARTGQIGDGKVWTVDVGQLVRIRTGEHGEDAL